VFLDGRESPKSVEARQFGQWLAEVTGVPVDFFDERFTSAEAENLLLDAELTKKRRKKRVDMLAAQIMLSAYLESCGRGRHDPGALDDGP
jgi:putative Holliday junction resolvase